MFINRILVKNKMKKFERRVRERLGDFYFDPQFLGKLAAMMVEVSEDDQGYVPEWLLKSLTGEQKYLESDIVDYFGGDGEDDSFNKTISFILSNKRIKPVALENCVPVFQDFFLVLCELAKKENNLAKMIMFYGTGCARWEWTDRQRDGIPYDPEIHGLITFSVVSSKKSE